MSKSFTFRATYLKASDLLFPDNKFFDPKVVVAPKVIITVSIISLTLTLLLLTDSPVILFTAALIAFSENNTGNSSMVSSLKFSIAKSMVFLFNSSAVNFFPSFFTKLIIDFFIPCKLLNTFVLEPANPEKNPSNVAIVLPAIAALVKASSSVNPAFIKSDRISSTDCAEVLAYDANPIPVPPDTPKAFDSLCPPFISAKRFAMVCIPP